MMDRRHNYPLRIGVALGLLIHSLGPGVTWGQGSDEAQAPFLGNWAGQFAIVAGRTLDLRLQISADPQRGLLIQSGDTTGSSGRLTEVRIEGDTLRWEEHDDLWIIYYVATLSADRDSLTGVGTVSPFNMTGFEGNIRSGASLQAAPENRSPGMGLDRFSGRPDPAKRHQPGAPGQRSGRHPGGGDPSHCPQR